MRALSPRFGVTDMFGPELSGKVFAAHWMTKQEECAISATMVAIPESPVNITYCSLWPRIPATYGARETRFGGSPPN
jgi:hypothetical protein